MRGLWHITARRGGVALGRPLIGSVLGTRLSFVVPKIAQYSLPTFAARAGGMTVLSTFTAMAK